MTGATLWMARVNCACALLVLDSPWILVFVLALVIVIAVAVFRIIR